MNGTKFIQVREFGYGETVTLNIADIVELYPSRARDVRITRIVMRRGSIYETTESIESLNAKLAEAE